MKKVEVPWSIRPEFVQDLPAQETEVKKEVVGPPEPPKVKKETVTITIPKKDKQEKGYLILLSYSDESGDSDWEFVTGQANAREFLINRINEIDLYESKVIVEDWPFGLEHGCPSVYDFLTWINDSYDDGFDPADYSLHSLSDEDKQIQEIESMQSIIDGDVQASNQMQQQNDTLSSASVTLKEI
jgi:hypothetical protein